MKHLTTEHPFSFNVVMSDVSALCQGCNKRLVLLSMYLLIILLTDSSVYEMLKIMTNAGDNRNVLSCVKNAIIFNLN